MNIPLQFFSTKPWVVQNHGIVVCVGELIGCAGIWEDEEIGPLTQFRKPNRSFHTQPPYCTVAPTTDLITLVICRKLWV